MACAAILGGWRRRRSLASWDGPSPVDRIVCHDPGGISAQEFQTTFNLAAVGIAHVGLDGQWLRVNRQMCDMLGYTREELLASTFRAVSYAEDLDKDDALLQETLDGKRSAYTLEKRYVRKDGSPVWVSNHVSAVKSRDGKVHEAIAVVVDITERRRALAAERRLAAIISSSEDAILGIDLDMMITDWNVGAEKVYGYSADEVVGRSVAILIPDDRVDEERRIIERIKAGERVEPHDTIRRHKSGRDVEVSLSVSPIYDPQGRIVGASKIARDISARMEAERVKNVLIGELNHRVKNVLATVTAIARQTFAKASDLELAAATFDARLRSLARAHDLLTHGNWESARVDRIVQEALSPYPAERFEISGPAVPASPKLVVALSLILHELSTNAAKYGALSADAGRVRVSWVIDEAEKPKLMLDWHESDGPDVEPPTRKGFGSRLIEGLLVGELGGQVRSDFHPSGLHCRIEALLDVDWSTQIAHPSQ